MLFKKENGPTKQKKKVLICSNYAWTIFNFRQPLINNLIKNNYEVELLTQFDGYENKITSQLSGIHSLHISRKGVNIITDLITTLHIIFNLIRIKPDIILLYTIKPVIYGSIASKILKIPSIPMVTGLGTTFISRSWITGVVKSLYKIALKKQKIVFFQNEEDKNLFLVEKLINKNQAKLVPGSGIDTKKYKYVKMSPKKKLTFLLIARMIKDKGVIEFVEAASMIKSKYQNISFKILGPKGVQNRTAISDQVINEWQKKGIVEYLGETDNVLSFIVDSDCIVLPSYREGTSRVLLEAAAVGRPIITTNVPGCKEVVDDNINGLLCKEKNSLDLSKKIEQMINFTNEERSQMGIEGRNKVKKEFNANIVNKIYFNAINELNIV
jgi:glycosyltransferase involved in cell wall biosynthesis